MHMMSEKASIPSGRWGGYGGVFRGVCAYGLRRRESTSKTQCGVTSTGRWGGFIKASAYGGGLVVVDVAVSERYSATGNMDATSVLPKQRSTSVNASTPSGRWEGFML